MVRLQLDSSTALARIGTRGSAANAPPVLLRQRHVRGAQTTALLPPAKVQRGPTWHVIPRNARSMGIHIMAGRGSGKSRLMGRAIAYDDFRSEVPLLIFDPMGGTIDNFLDKVARQASAAEREATESRIVYVDMSGRGEQIVPFPLYVRVGDESYFEVASRLGDLIGALDPNLASAPIQGLNAVTRASTYLGMLLAALECQVTELFLLLRAPEHALGRLEALARDSIVLEQPMAFLRMLRTMSDRERESLLSSLEVKLMPLILDDRQRALFGARLPGVDWEDVIEHRRAVLLDFRREHNAQLRRFKMLWTLSYFMAFVKDRGRGRHAPVSIIIDELTELVDVGSADDTPFEKELNALVNVYARNCSLWLTICHQEAFQLRPYTYKTLMGMGTQVLGATSDTQAALQVAADMFAVNPYRIKAVEYVWGSRHVPEYVHDRTTDKEKMILQTRHERIDSRPVFLGVDEQHYINASAIRNLKLFEFLVRIATREGENSQAVYPVHIRNLDMDIWPDEDQVKAWREDLRRISGVDRQAILEELAVRRRALFERHPSPGAQAARRRGEPPLQAPDPDDWDASEP